MENSSPKTAVAEPVHSRDRIFAWDLLRGFAVLGVLLANMPLMSLSAAWTFEAAAFGTDRPEDFAAFAFVRLFADTKFITIFSLLFGAGLGIMSEKAIAQGDRPFVGLYLRRVGVLFWFGLLHGIVLWGGDILLHYALVGAVAVWFRRVSPKILFALGAALLVLSILFWVGFGWLGFYKADTAPWKTTSTLLTHYELYANGSLLDIIAYRAEVFPVTAIFISLMMGPRTLGLFFIGMGLVKVGALRDVESQRTRWRRVVGFGLLFGIPIQVVWLSVALACGAGPIDDPRASNFMLNSFLSAIAALVLSPAYIGIMALWTASTVLRGLKERLAAVGRMALTNYLSHSILTFLIFQVGRQWDRWGRFETLLLCGAIFAFQLWFSPWWLARFRFGPFEWVWRSLTYWRRQPMRWESASA